MSRRHQAEDSSLELLLDTITNTFGGILFLAILVSLLLRTSSFNASREATPARDFMSPVEQAAYEVELEDLQDRFVRLSKEHRPKAPHSAPVSPDAAEIAAALNAEILWRLDEQAQAALETNTSQRNAAIACDKISQLEECHAAAVARHEAALQANAKTEAEALELARIRLRLDSSEQPSTIEQTAGLPTLRSTNKRQVALYLRFGKVFLMHAWSNGSRMGPNPVFFTVVPGSPPVAFPKPAAGLPLEGMMAARTVEQLLAGFEPAKWVVAVVVFSDSFKEFQLVKQLIIDAGYEYVPIAGKPSGFVMDAGGASHAQ